MKKLITAILALIYMGTSTGATLRFHYCMGELAGWGFGDKEAKHCAGCGMTKQETDSKGCCKDEHKFIKNNTDQKNTETGFSNIVSFTAVEPPASIVINCFPPVIISPKQSFGNAPPRRCGTPVYILNCVFLI